MTECEWPVYMGDGPPAESVAPEEAASAEVRIGRTTIFGVAYIHGRDGEYTWVTDQGIVVANPLEERLMAEELKVEPIPPEPFPDGKVEMHPDGGGVTIYRTMTQEQLAERFPDPTLTT